MIEADGCQPHLIAPEQGCRRLIESSLVTIKGLEGAVDAVHAILKELVRKSISETMILPNDVDLLNLLAELEKRKHKLKCLVQSPNSFFESSSSREDQTTQSAVNYRETTQAIKLIAMKKMSAHQTYFSSLFSTR